METNAIILAVLVAVMPLLVEMLKAWSWADKNKRWFGPLVCVVLAAAAAYWRQVDMWLFVGVSTGMAASKAYDFYGDIKENISGPAGGSRAAGWMLPLCLAVMLMAGCTRLPLSQAARGELATTAATAKALMPACQSGDDGACATILAVEQKTLRHLASSIEGSDPNCKGYVGWMASSAYKEQILKADLLASHARKQCATDPNFCRVGVNLLAVIERLQSAAAGVK